jgi:hypothetical protein
MDQILTFNQVGPVSATSSLPNGLQQVNRAGNMGEQIASELQPRYYENTYRRNTFTGANQAAATTTVGLATTYTGLCLSNPIGSGVNLVLLKCGYAAIVAFPAGAAIGLMVGYNATTNVTHTTPGTPASSFVGVGAAPLAKLDVAATLPTAPTLHTLFGSGLTGAITTAPQSGPAPIDLEGSIILPPGAYAAFYTSTVSGAGFFGSFSWMEVPV